MLCGGGGRIINIHPPLCRCLVALQNDVSTPISRLFLLRANSDAGTISSRSTAEIQTPFSEPSPHAQPSLFDEHWLYDIDWAVGSEPWMENPEVQNMQSWPPPSRCITWGYTVKRFVQLGVQFLNPNSNFHIHKDTLRRYFVRWTFHLHTLTSPRVSCADISGKINRYAVMWQNRFASGAQLYLPGEIGFKIDDVAFWRALFCHVVSINTSNRW